MAPPYPTAFRQRMPRSRVSCPVHGSGETLLTLANCLSTTVSITLSTIPVEAPNCHSGVGWPSVDHVAIYPHESGTAPHFLALPTFAAGSQRVPIVTALADASAPASFQRFVNDEGEAAASGVEGLHQQGEQAATTFEGGPAGTIEHLMVETERRGVVQPRVPQGCRHGAPSAGQQGSDEQALDFAPSGCAKETLKGRQEGASGLNLSFGTLFSGRR